MPPLGPGFCIAIVCGASRCRSLQVRCGGCCVRACVCVCARVRVCHDTGKAHVSRKRCSHNAHVCRTTLTLYCTTSHMGCCSGCTDACLVACARAMRVDSARVCLLFSALWPVLVFACRPFSNTAEMTLVACFLATACSTPRTLRGRVGRGACAGTLLALGVFIRFTFVAFVLPVVGAWLLSTWRRAWTSHTQG